MPMLRRRPSVAAESPSFGSGRRATPRRAAGLVSIVLTLLCLAVLAPGADAVAATRPAGDRSVASRLDCFDPGAIDCFAVDDLPECPADARCNDKLVIAECTPGRWRSGCLWRPGCPTFGVCSHPISNPGCTTDAASGRDVAPPTAEIGSYSPPAAPAPWSKDASDHDTFAPKAADAKRPWRSTMRTYYVVDDMLLSFEQAEALGLDVADLIVLPGLRRPCSAAEGIASAE